MIHPIEPQKDVARKFPMLGKLPPGIIDYFSRFFPPVRLSHITGICSEATGEEIDGWLLACPMTPRRMLQVSASAAYKKIVQTGRLAERLGAQILGLGAFTAVVGDSGISVSDRLAIPVTTGNSYTVATAVEASLETARRMEIDPAQCTAAVIGAYGSAGTACAHLLARSVRRLLLIGRKIERLQQIERQVDGGEAQVSCTTDLSAIKQADVVLTVTSAVEPIVEPHHLKPGAVVCDVARPRNVSRRVAERRDDVLVIDGGIVDMPGEVDFGFDFGLPHGKAYACMAETAILALEGRYENYTVGRDVSLAQIDEIAKLASKHGFHLSGYRSFERAMTDREIEKIKERARLARTQHST